MICSPCEEIGHSFRPTNRTVEIPKPTLKSASAEPEQSPPPVIFSQQKGMMLQSRCPRRPPIRVNRRSRPAEVGHHQPPPRQWCLLTGQAQTSSAVDPSSFPMFSFQPRLLFVFQLLPFLAFNLRSDIASSFSVKMQAAPSSVPFHKDED
ncbi:hypothetical protein GWK47_049935 [Chionoecetes opilio]|uniref:Uncharacterized protein n=1 Tax=Chionoecetes opilio TaxID=41210 RepID=A0A8J4Y8V7_CHIOP|nr:hypothetical protein GWK47_049935 [Chionoecetes opilio]